LAPKSTIETSQPQRSAKASAICWPPPPASKATAPGAIRQRTISRRVILAAKIGPSRTSLLK
jgi:hypothetical protein